MKIVNILFFGFCSAFICTAQVTLIGGACEGCEAIFENKTPFQNLTHELTLPTGHSNQTTLTITGTVYARDGKTPASDVILYVYHTDQTGRYTANAGATGWEKRHGSIRGWLKTNKQGAYAIHTIMPAPYPSDDIAAHIHIFLKEPNKNPYWIEEYVFEGDPFLKSTDKNIHNPRGGSGLLKVEVKDHQQKARRDIILGLNIPNYK